MTEQSYGFIPLLRTEEGLKVFLIHQYGSGGDMLWTFPKGRGEEGETPLNTAIRELEEETGLTIVSCDDSKHFSISYSFVRQGVPIEKTTTYYLGFVGGKEFKVQPEEVKEAGWFSIDAAKDQLTFPTTKKLFDEALSHLDK